MMDEMVIRINPISGLMTVDDTADGIVSRKNISADTLLNCVRGSLKRDMVSSGLLPPNTISTAMSDQGSRDVCLWHPTLKANITYHKTVYTDFPLPRLLFGFSVSMEGRISHCRLGVVKDERLKPSTPMYVYPFSNVVGFDLCIGNNPLPKCESPHTLASVPYMLLEMPNNNDRYTHNRNKPGFEYRELLEHLKGKDSAYYYTDILLPSGKTVQDFILNND